MLTKLRKTIAGLVILTVALSITTLFFKSNDKRFGIGAKDSQKFSINSNNNPDLVKLKRQLAKIKKKLSKATRTYRLKKARNRSKYKKIRARYIKEINRLRAKIKELSNPNSADIGIFSDHPQTKLPEIESSVNNHFKVFLWYQSIGEDFDSNLANWLYSRGTTLELAWEPHNPAKDPKNQPEYSLKTIISGHHDKDIYRWAMQIKQFGHPIYFRPMSEMNGDWVAWGETNGNKPDEYVKAWQHIHNIFGDAGVNNAYWLWSPNADNEPKSALETFNQYYPGNHYVDYIGLDGYNWGTLYDTPNWKSKWKNFNEVFGSSYLIFTNLTAKEIIISETATTSSGGNKSAWIKNTFYWVKYKYKKIKLITWFNVNKETDWRFNENASSLDAFKRYAFSN